MMRRANTAILVRAALVPALCMVAACESGSDSETVRGSGTIVTEAREVEGFDEIRLEGSGDVVVEIGDRESLTIETDDNLLQLIDTEVTGSRLVIDHEGSLNPTAGIVYRIEAIDFDGVTIAGSADVVASDVDCDTFSVTVAGSGSIELEGSCAVIDVDIAGSGDLDAGGLSVDRATVSIAGSGDVIVDAAEELQVSIAGSGNVVYLGDPATDIDVQGSGEVRQGP
jgi:hypothetical protein